MDQKRILFESWLEQMLQADTFILVIVLFKKSPSFFILPHINFLKKKEIKIDSVSYWQSWKKIYTHYKLAIWLKTATPKSFSS